MKHEPRRLALIRQYGSLYFRHLDAGSDCCFYCGDQRQCLDHRPPLRVLETVEPSALREAQIPFVLLPCCADCNGRLGARPDLLTARDACVWLCERLEREYERRATLWSDEEERAMSPMFQRIIRAKREAANLLVGRIRFMQARQFDDALMPVFYGPQDEES